jgi:arachidonate 15-lipoxygenase
MTAPTPRLRYQHRYQLPQYVSEDRQRAREDTLHRMRQRFELETDLLKGSPEPGYYGRLPAGCRKLPAEAQFTTAKRMELVSGTMTTRANGLLVKGLSRLLSSGSKTPHYHAVFRMVDGPSSIMDRWREDAEFARQRLSGANPMHIRQLRNDEPTALWEAARLFLGTQKQDIQDLLKKGRLFQVDYSVLWDSRVQSRILPAPSPRQLAAPTCLFWTDDRGTLMPLAIQLMPRSVSGYNPVFTPQSPPYDWLMARAHVTAADAHLHEGIYHLLETHLVNGAVALGMYRQLHPDHPLRQLLEPHYEYTLAINKLAETRLLNLGGPFDTALTAGVEGTFEAMRLHYVGWSWSERKLTADLPGRGVNNPNTLPHYYYRDDSLLVHEAITDYVTSLLRLWYESDGDVTGDYELQAWAEELSNPDKANVSGFPKTITTRDQLYGIAADLIFRAGPQHAAVNNGQFEAYGFIPNMPGRIKCEFPKEVAFSKPHYTEEDFWKALPDLRTTMAQMSMVWVLSTPTVRTLLHSGESPAFHPSICIEADELIGSFRRRLKAISDSIERRNEALDVPYRYLNPKNISRSTDI